MIKDRKIGLALSGGGFRAAAFHLGTFKKLEKLGILEKVDVISTISGGSIVGAYYALNKNNEKWIESFKKILGYNLIGRACLSVRFLLPAIIILLSIISVAMLGRSFSWTIIYVLIAAIIIGCFFYKIFPTTLLIRGLYNKLIYDKKKLKDLPSDPKLIINSTNLDTGTLFSFTREYSFDSSYKYPPFNGDYIFDMRNELIATAVSCSTAVPYAFSPAEFKIKEGSNTRVPKLVDGGVYDNQGIYRITGDSKDYRTDIVLVSDGSAPFKKGFFSINPLPVMSRIMSVMMRRIKSVQFKQNIYEEKEDELWEIGYYSLDWEYENCLNGFYNAAVKNTIRPHLLEYHKITEEMKKNKDLMIEHLKKNIGYDVIVKNGLTQEEIEFVKSVSTSLSSLSEKEIELLERHAEVLTEIQIELFCPELLN